MDHDQLQSRWSGGDLLVWVSADDATSVSYAVRRLVADAAPFAKRRWSQPGNWRPVDASGAAIRNTDGTQKSFSFQTTLAGTAATGAAVAAKHKLLLLRQRVYVLDIAQAHVRRLRPEAGVELRIAGRRELAAAVEGAIDA